MWVVLVRCAFACYIQSWFRFAGSLVQGEFSVGADLGQVWIRFGSILFQVWFSFGSGLVHALWSIGSTGSFRPGRLARQTWFPHVWEDCTVEKWKESCVRCVCAVRLHVSVHDHNILRLAVG